jgi:hypothetical protein
LQEKSIINQKMNYLIKQNQKKEIMNIENTKAQMRKGVLEFCILSVLKEKDAYIGNIRHIKKRKVISS